jgi:hypothetical protein
VVVHGRGHFGRPSFRFLRLLAYDALPVADLGMRYARPELMALANLLEHPAIRPDRIAGLVASDGAPVKRSNKDLGRVLALVMLEQQRGQQHFSPWSAAWASALRHSFPHSWQADAGRAGVGLRALLESRPDFAQAAWSCRTGLLATMDVADSDLRIAAARLITEAIEPLEVQARA